MRRTQSPSPAEWPGRVYGRRANSTEAVSCLLLDPVERDAVADKSLEAEVGGLGAGDDGRAMTFQLAEVAVTDAMVRAILSAIRRLRAPSSCA